LNCVVCDDIYIGQCGRALKSRISEHKKSILNNKTITGFSEHCITHNHFLDVKLLHSENKGRRMDLLEILEIKKAIKNNKYVTNEQTDFDISPLLKSII
jgi:hypothetical protein